MTIGTQTMGNGGDGRIGPGFAAGSRCGDHSGVTGRPSAVRGDLRPPCRCGAQVFVPADRHDARRRSRCGDVPGGNGEQTLVQTWESADGTRAGEVRISTPAQSGPGQRSREIHCGLNPALPRRRQPHQRSLPEARDSAHRSGCPARDPQRGSSGTHRTRLADRRQGGTRSAARSRSGDSSGTSSKRHPLPSRPRCTVRRHH
ncbi:hypothetical protein JOF56_000716 [Kibdelosporangium banguiense]|uniref:Uncharacterized protein n=1 Tax=Kibdelosporangium banguiense TaxID=1365924 RepID=A0ABS4T7P7_9PSEU|nr:hypothetical protein [Kibdelosporangium banguiense]